MLKKANLGVNVRRNRTRSAAYTVRQNFKSGNKRGTKRTGEGGRTVVFHRLGSTGPAIHNAGPPHKGLVVRW